MELSWFVASGAVFGCLVYCFIARALCLVDAKWWFGKPHPGSIRLFGSGKLRPIQRIDALQVPFLGIGNSIHSFKLIGTAPSRQKADWAALGDGLVVGALAYRAVAASSDQAHSVLAELPLDLDRIEITKDPSQFLNEAQRVGYESWLQGHIGESVAANVLTQDGYEVEFAELPNQPGWDLIVNGVPMNVKVGESAASNIADHFEKYPEIPVITDTQTAAAFDHPDVYGVPGLEPDRIERISAEVLGDSSLSPGDSHSGVGFGDSGDVGESMTEGAAEASGGILDAGVPWITIGTSFMREGRLAKQYGGNAAESTGAIAADAAGVGLGAKFGAAVGMLFGPAGALIGAVGGACIGKYFVNNIRRNNVEAEIKKFRSRVEEIERQFALAIKRFDAEYHLVIEKWNALLEQSTRSKRRTFEAYIAQLLQEHNSATLAFLDSVYQLFDVFDRWLDLDLDEIRRRFPARNPVLRFLLPSSADAARDLAEAWIENKRRELHYWRDRFARFPAEGELTGTTDFDAARQLIIDFFGKYHVWDASVVPILEPSVLKFDDIAKRATTAHKKVMKRILQEFRKCERSARQELHAKWQLHEDEIESMARNLDKDMRDLIRRAARAGVNSLPSPLDALAQMRKGIRQGIDQSTSRSRQLAKLPLFSY